MIFIARSYVQISREIICVLWVTIKTLYFGLHASAVKYDYSKNTYNEFMVTANLVSLHLVLQHIINYWV